MADIGFIGLGIMGRPMAANLVRAGHRVLGYSRTDTSRAAAAEVGVTAVGTLAEAARAETVITMLPDSPDVAEVVLGEGGVATSIPRGGLLIDMSTIAPSTALEVHAALADRGVDVVDAPVSGGEAAAVEGSLSVMAGGSVQAVERARPILEPMSATITHVGDAGAGQVVKAANQIMVAGHIQMLSEALLFLRSHGVDEEAAVTAIGGGLAGSTVMARKAAGMMAGSYAPGFRIELHHKDLGIAREAARRHGLSLPVTAAVAELVQAVVARGDGGLDHSALFPLLEALNGTARGASA